ncbi:GNAT family N-acetyltransferase [Variovorax sp. PCZ-1]|uniref:GNAT family N-acetyltransferase n=1 Tax=Variovorax sp. PCZ-1 TaxID=2835533 RepID=UPI001BCE9FDB|nr:GNAT family N-acetyltransferase [Variovorax sp. PCZ-1]MBS7807240.1 N-acetyltransferase [Variovorax sp. PCZ-1]
MTTKDYVTRIHSSPLEIDVAQWNALLKASDLPTPFMRHEYLAAMQTSNSAVKATGWDARFVALYSPDEKELLAACPLYVKTHSYGEYVFDWAWARAYQENGLAYYPKATIAVPFTPVPGTRFLCKNGFSPSYLLREVLSYCEQEDVSSLHTLFASESDQHIATDEKLMLRETVQFHWQNASYNDFDAYLATLAQDKRKKIRAERRKVSDAGMTWRWSQGVDISSADWDFFYTCYERTYLEHGNPPYLNREFFQGMQETMPENWLLFIAEHSGKSIACSMIAIQDTINSVALCADSVPANSPKSIKKVAQKVAYGRYWGAIARVDSLHFEACYYQPLQWCIEHGFDRFEGGAQGEHKMARGLLPVVTRSAHWLAHPQFADAVNRFLERERLGIGEYVEHLAQRNPFRELS